MIVASAAILLSKSASQGADLNILSKTSRAHREFLLKSNGGGRHRADRRIEECKESGRRRYGRAYQRRRKQPSSAGRGQCPLTTWDLRQSCMQGRTHRP